MDSAKVSIATLFLEMVDAPEVSRVCTGNNRFTALGGVGGNALTVTVGVKR